MKTEWISVKDRLPRQGKDVLVVWKNFKGKKNMNIAKVWKDKRDWCGWHFSYYEIDGSSILDDSQVSHWTPLPKLP